VASAAGVVGLALSLYGLSRSLGKTCKEEGKGVPATAGTLHRDPVWARNHIRYYGYALLFLAFTLGIRLAAQVLLGQVT